MDKAEREELAELWNQLDKLTYTVKEISINLNQLHTCYNAIASLCDKKFKPKEIQQSIKDATRKNFLEHYHSATIN